jgi:hypothetical protein
MRQKNRLLDRQREHSFPQPSSERKEDSIYRMSTDGKDLKRLIKDARFPSLSTP